MLTISLAILLSAAVLVAVREAVLRRRVHPQAAAESVVSRFQQQLERELLRSERTGRPVCLAVLALAGGQQFDPERRRELAAVAIGKARVIDSCYEIAGDELAVVLTETRAGGALRATDRIRQALLDAGCTDPRAGIAEAGPGIDRGELFRHAYCALLAAGVDGRPPVLVYALEMEIAGRATDHSGTVH